MILKKRIALRIWQYPTEVSELSAMETLVCLDAESLFRFRFLFTACFTGSCGSLRTRHSSPCIENVANVRHFVLYDYEARSHNAIIRLAFHN